MRPWLAIVLPSVCRLSHSGGKLLGYGRNGRHGAKREHTAAFQLTVLFLLQDHNPHQLGDSYRTVLETGGDPPLRETLQAVRRMGTSSKSGVAKRSKLTATPQQASIV